MITVEGKLDVFTKLVLEKVQGEYEEKKREIDKKNNEIIGEHREVIKKKVDKIIEDMTVKGEVEKNRMVSKAKIGKKRAVLSKKEELLTTLVKKIEKMAFQFTYEDGYGDYLKNSLVEVLENLKNKDHIALYITDRDQDRFKEMIEELIETRGANADKVELCSLDRDFIGGIIGVDEERTIKVDCSIKSKIDDNRGFIGQILYRELADNG